MNYSPKSNFQEMQKDSCEELKKQSPSKWFSVSLDYSMSQLAFQGASQEELSGARRLVALLITMAEKADTVPVFPTRSLETYDNPSPLRAAVQQKA